MSKDDVVQALEDEMATLRGRLRSAPSLDIATPAAGWDVRDTVSHLYYTDLEAVRALTDPRGFESDAPAKRGNPEFILGHLRSGRELGGTLLTGWHEGQRRLLRALRSAPPGNRVPWFGPSMSSTSMATARLMEYWAHGRDISDALTIETAPTERLWHIARLGFRTRGWSYAVRGLHAPDCEVAVDLTAPDGTAWSFGDPTAPESVSGPVEDFCLVVTQRRNFYDTELVADGPSALEWMSIAQCFAGAASEHRPPTSAAVLRRMRVHGE